MTEKLEAVTLQLDASLGPEVRLAFADAGIEARFLERNNIGGDAATLIVMATLSVQALPHLLKFLGDRAERAGVRRAKIFELEFENPTEADLELIRQIARERMTGKAPERP